MATARSPFPGMDPWLEGDWDGVHTRLATYSCDQLQEQLGGGLVARLEQRVYVEAEFQLDRYLVPDVHLYDRGRRSPRRATGGGVVVAEPEVYQIPAETRETYIEIRDHKAREKLITIIEFVSPTNKQGVVGRRKYLQKRRDAVRAGVNIVEVDLLRGGRDVTLARTRLNAEEMFDTAYHVSVYRDDRPTLVGHVPISIRERLPAVGVPLRTKDADVVLNLQPLLDQTYRNGRYDEVLDYARPPIPPLATADATWAKRLIAAWRKRSN